MIVCHRGRAELVMKKSVHHVRTIAVDQANVFQLKIQHYLTFVYVQMLNLACHAKRNHQQQQRRRRRQQQLHEHCSRTHRHETIVIHWIHKVVHMVDNVYRWLMDINVCVNQVIQANSVKSVRTIYYHENLNEIVRFCFRRNQWMWFKSL